MAKVSLSLIDSYGRTSKRVYELEDQATIAAYEAAVTAFLVDYQAVSDLGVVRCDLILTAVVPGYAVTAGANVDVGATFSGLVDGGNGKKASLKLPGVKPALVSADGSVDIEGVEIAAWLDNWETAGDFQLSDGETIATWLRGVLDK
jgi:hypothetical protein